jgi:hypothetical protein
MAQHFAMELFSFLACMQWLAIGLAVMCYVLRQEVEYLYLSVVLLMCIVSTAAFSAFRNTSNHSIDQHINAIYAAKVGGTLGVS